MLQQSKYSRLVIQGRHWAVVAAVAVAMAAPAWAADASDNAKQAVDQAGRAVNNAGEAIGQATEKAVDKAQHSAEAAGAGNPTASNPAPDAKDIDEMMGDLTNAALTKDGMNKVVGYFVDADRNRISADLDKQNEDDFGPKLDGRINQIQKAWKAKYGHEFDLDHAQQVFTEQFSTVRQGKIGSDADLQADVMKNSGSAAAPGAEKANGNTSGDENLEQGRGIAVVTVKASHGAPELKVPLIHELPDSWKVNVPDTMTGTKLRQNLLDHLTKCGEMSDQWPTEEIEAYRAIAHHVLMAVLDQPVQ